MWCCSGTGIEAFAKLPEHVFATTVRSAIPELHILQYISASLQWDAERVTVVLHATDLSRSTPGQALVLAVSFRAFPDGGPAASSESGQSGVADRLGGGANMRFTLKIRISSWAWLGTAPSAEINGEPIPIHHGASVLEITRTWSMGDRLTISLWPSLRLVAAPDTRPQFSSLRAVFYGPVLLAALAHEVGIRRLGAPATNPSQWLTPVPREVRVQYVSIRESLPDPIASASAWVHAQGQLSLRQVPEPPQSERPFGGGGTNASAAATWRMQPANDWGMAGAFVFEAYDRPGMYLASRGVGQHVELSLGPTPESFHVRPALNGEKGASSFESSSRPGWYVSCAGGAPPKLRALRLERAPSVTLDAAFKKSSSFKIANATEAPPPLAFWARPPLRDTPSGGEGFLMYALNEVLDERYSVYLQLD